MKTIPLPRTGLTVSQLCLGTNQFGTALDEPRALEMLDTFRALGGNFIDTAHGYADWIPSAPRAASEHCIGRWLARQRRDSVVIATKGCEFDYRAGFTPRVTPEHLRTDLEGSLAALGTDYIDLYWLHRDDPSHPVEAILDALIAHQRAGRIRHFGCSNWSVSRIQLAQRYAASIGHEGFVACQPMWGLAEPDRAAMQQFAPGGYYEDGYRALHEAGLTMIPYSGQSRGIFTRLAGGQEESIAADVRALYLSDTNRRKLGVVRELALKHNATVNAVVLAYLTSQPLPTVPIIGASSVAQLRESVGSCALVLSVEELDTLRNA